MNKPLILKYKETEEKIIQEINKSEMPVYVLKIMLEKIFNQLTEIENKEVEEYKTYLEKEKGKEKNEKK